MIQTLFSVSLFLTGQTHCEIRLTSTDACRLIEMVESTYAEISEHLMRSRELAIQSANSTVTPHERGYLDAEFTQRKDEILRLINQSEFTDSFLANYFYLRDGLSFVTLVHSNFSHMDYVYHAEIQPFLPNIGRMANRLFAVKNPSIASSGFLKIGDVTVSDAYYVDTVSHDGAEHSAIKIAGQINSTVDSTLVHAEVLANRVSLKKIDLGQLPPILREGHFKINGVSVTGRVLNSIENFRSVINQVSNSSGVKAQNEFETGEVVDLVAYDGRNITLEVSKEVASAVGLELQVGTRNTFAGAIRLSSVRPFEMTAHDYGYLGFEGIQVVPFNESASIFETSILTQIGATAALGALYRGVSYLNDAMVAVIVLHNGCGEAL